MIDHTGIGVADVARSALFYDAALGALGLRRVMQLPENDGADGVGYGVDHPVFWIDRFHPHGVKQHTAFVARNRAPRSMRSTRPRSRQGEPKTETVSRLGQPMDIAAAVCFLASPLTDFMTGTTFRIDGGSTPTV
jgi:NAD(P)-dependent dehydrogenase (short-subunit alcohol dehydrogenase family)